MSFSEMQNLAPVHANKNKVYGAEINIASFGKAILKALT